jgi:hypothetical protein
MPKQRYWTNRSVLALAGRRDPVEEISRRVRDVVVKALDAGWSGPPFDPLDLADALGIAVRPSDDVPEARLVVTGKSACIEYNPNRPRGRMRYSIAHEIAHTLFPDHGDETRYRKSHQESKGDSWQLEALCNLAAAEILMPAASLPSMNGELGSIESLMELRKTFEVSAEALLRRVVRSQETPCAMFCASRQPNASTYQIDYTAPSHAWDCKIDSGAQLPKKSVVAECVAIGYTAKGEENWLGSAVHVECVGVPGSPGSPLPRVVGVISMINGSAPAPMLQYLVGNALQPRGLEPKMIVHLTNDKAASWGGGGFSNSIGAKWQPVHDAYRTWAASRRPLSLGDVHFADASSDITIASVVAQKGYGVATGTRLRYQALRSGLVAVGAEATKRNATIHMPRIGTGLAGGTWEVVEEIVREALCDSGIRVTVYDLPTREMSARQKAGDVNLTGPEKSKSIVIPTKQLSLIS